MFPVSKKVTEHVSNDSKLLIADKSPCAPFGKGGRVWFWFCNGLISKYTIYCAQLLTSQLTTLITLTIRQLISKTYQAQRTVPIATALLKSATSVGHCPHCVL